jgi:hypothetical protein
MLCKWNHSYYSGAYGILTISLFFRQYMAINSSGSFGLSISTRLRAGNNNGKIVFLK